MTYSGPTTWTKEREALLLKLHRQILVTSDRQRGWRKELAQRLGVREAQLIAKLGRAYKTGKLVKIHAGHPGIRAPRKAKPEPELIVVAPKPIQLKPPPSTRVCQYPLWPNNTRPPKPPCFCGKRTEEGSSWCSEHYKQVFHPRRRMDTSLADCG